MGYSCFKTQQKLKRHWYWYLILQVSKRDRKKGKKMTLAMLKTIIHIRVAFQVIMAEKMSYKICLLWPDDFLTATSFYILLVTLPRCML